MQAYCLEKLPQGMLSSLAPAEPRKRFDKFSIRPTGLTSILRTTWLYKRAKKQFNNWGFYIKALNQTHSIGMPGKRSLIAVTMAVMRESDV